MPKNRADSGLDGSQGRESERLNPEQWVRVEALVDEILDLDLESRPSALQEAEHDNPAVAARARELLTAMEDGNGRLFETPLYVSAPEIYFEATEEAAQGRAGTQLGPYRLEKVLGRGGMGVVYLAERADEEFEKRVAVKLMPRGLESQEAERRFRLERQVLARLEHPNVARLIDGGVTDEGYPFLVMELVEGEPIDEYCDSQELDIEERLTLLIDVCSAVQYAHQNLIIHRDLKPGNVLVSTDGVPKLLDFGIAKLIEEEPEAKSHTRVQPKTTAYASPEQLADRSVSTASDVYSIGVMLHEVLTGELPGKTGVPGSPVPSDLRGIVHKATADSPAERYATAIALADDLGRYLSGLPVTAREPTAGYRLRKFIARHRIGFIASAAATLALTAALVLALWQADRASTQARRAERVAGLLKGLFVDADPYAPTSGEVTILELLDRGVERIDTELADDPEIRDELSTVLGNAYVGLGYRDQGIPVLRQTLAERRGRLGDRHLLTADSMRLLGYALLGVGELEEAANLVEGAYAIAEEHYGPDAPEAPEYLFNLGLLRAAQGNREDQEAIFRRLVVHYRRHGKNTSTSLALALGQLSVALDYQGRNDESLEIQRSALGMADETFGPDHPYTSAVRSNMGLRLFGAGALEEAEHHFREALTALESRPGVHQEEIVAPLSNLGLVLMAQGDFVGAAEHIRRAAEIARGSQSPDDLTRIGSEINLATVERELGRLEIAKAMYRDALGRFERILGPEHQATARAHCLLGMTLWQAGMMTAAERELETALAVQRQEGVAPMSLDDTLLALGRLRLDQGGLEEAGILLGEALAVRRDSLPEGSWPLAEVELELALLAAARGEPDADLATRSRRTLTEVLPENDFRLRRATKARG